MAGCWPPAAAMFWRSSAACSSVMSVIWLAVIPICSYIWARAQASGSADRRRPRHKTPPARRRRPVDADCSQRAADTRPGGRSQIQGGPKAVAAPLTCVRCVASREVSLLIRALSPSLARRGRAQATEQLRIVMGGSEDAGAVPPQGTSGQRRAGEQRVAGSEQRAAGSGLTRGRRRRSGGRPPRPLRWPRRPAAPAAPG